MKKVICLVMTLCLCLGMFAGCGNNGTLVNSAKDRFAFTADEFRSSFNTIAESLSIESIRKFDYSKTYVHNYEYEFDNGISLTLSSPEADEQCHEIELKSNYAAEKEMLPIQKAIIKSIMPKSKDDYALSVLEKVDRATNTSTLDDTILKKYTDNCLSYEYMRFKVLDETHLSFIFSPINFDIGEFSTLTISAEFKEPCSKAVKILDDYLDEKITAENAATSLKQIHDKMTSSEKLNYADYEITEKIDSISSYFELIDTLGGDFIDHLALSIRDYIALHIDIPRRSV